MAHSLTGALDRAACCFRRSSRRSLQPRRLGVHRLCEPKLCPPQQVQPVPAAPAWIHTPGAQVSSGSTEQGGCGEERGTVQSGRLGVRKVWVRLSKAASEADTNGGTTRAQEQTRCIPLRRGCCCSLRAPSRSRADSSLPSLPCRLTSGSCWEPATSTFVKLQFCFAA